MLFCSTFSTATSINFIVADEARAADRRAGPGSRLCLRPGRQATPGTRRARPRASPHALAGCVDAAHGSQRPPLPPPEMAAARAAAGAPGTARRGFRGPDRRRPTWAAGLTCTQSAAGASGPRLGAGWRRLRHLGRGALFSSRRIGRSLRRN